MRRILFFNRFVHPDHSATSQLLSDLAWHLSGQGWEVVLVGSRQGYDDAGARPAPRERVDGVDIVRLAGTRFGRATLVGRSMDYLSYYLGALLLALREVRSGDTVVTMTDPPMLSVLLGWWIRLRGARAVNWLQDLFPEVAESLLGDLVSGWRATLLRRLRDRSLRNAAINVVIGRRMAERLESARVPSRAIALVENWADDGAIQPIESGRNALRDAWGLGGSFVVGYSGNLGRAHDWQTMLEAATRLKDREDIRFLLIGAGPGLDAFASAARARSLDNVVMRPYQSRESLGQSLGAADVHWLTLLPSLEGLIVPSKLYGVLAAGRPCLFIGDADGEVARVLSAHGCGVTLAPGDVSGVVSVIEGLAGDPVGTVAMGQRARLALESGRRCGDALAKWSEVLDRVRAPC